VERWKQKELLAEAEHLTEQANILWNEGRYPATEPLCKKALRLTQNALGKNDARVAERLYNLATLYFFQQRFDEARPLYEEAVQIHESQFVVDKAALAFCYGWLGRTIFEAWRENPAIDGDEETDLESSASFKMTERCYLRARELLEASPYAESAEYAACLMHLAFFYAYTDRSREAETVYLRALALRENLFGPDHLETGECVGRLALLYLYHEALGIDPEPYLLRALQIRENRLESNHPEVMEWIYRVAEFYDSRKQGAKAKRLYGRLVDLLEWLPEDQASEMDRVTQGVLAYLRETGREREAEALEARLGGEESPQDVQRRVAAKREAMLGPEHPRLADSLIELAGTLRYEEEYAESESLFLRALAIREKAFGTDSPALLEIFNGLALLYRLQERHLEARDVLARALQIPPDGTQQHSLETARAVEHLAWIEAAEGQSERAEALFQQSITRMETMPQTDYRALAELLFRLSLFYSQEERYLESEACLFKTLAATEKTTEVYDLEIADYREQYAAILTEMGREKEAREQIAIVKRIWENAGSPREDL
jgi:tetratricopeptide (TPR) repeat protein